MGDWQWPVLVVITSASVTLVALAVVMAAPGGFAVLTSAFPPEGAAGNVGRDFSDGGVFVVGTAWRWVPLGRRASFLAWIYCGEKRK